ncbi:MAG TPA: glycosyltransferase, partial [Cytophagales bacterium]|nr:glycosyltransferase [Cytophagales bacterium]
MADQRSESTLIVFVKRPQLGKAKTRLAKTVGDEKALEIYKFLLRRTLEVIQPLTVDIQIHYATSPEPGDMWEQAGFARYSQIGGELGERMHHAIASAFIQGYRRVVIMGSDCYQLETDTLQQAFELLASHRAVLGPSTDGGYYLLGMTQLFPEFFVNKEWSTESVGEQTVQDFDRLGIPYSIFPPLTDID